VNTPRSDEDRLKLIELMVFLMKKGVCDEFGLNAARLSKDVDEEEEAQVPAQGDDVQELTAEEVATDVVPPTPTSPSPSSPVILFSPLHQPPCPPQPQDAEGSSLLFQRVLNTC
nr:hypothetical protein [Tanacetum cinerariifolium]